jgi:xylan 1,4-beta-xylosidase
MGSPQQPSSEEFKELEKAGQLQLFESPTILKIEEKQAIINFSLPRQGVSLVKLTW